MGDVAMVVPVVYSLARQYPDIRITVLSRAFAQPLFEGLAPNVGFMAADLKHEYKGIKGLNALYRRLAAKQFTAVADLHNVLRSEYLRMRFQLGHYRVAHINKHRKGRRRITATNHKQLVQQPTSFQNYVDVFAKLGYPVEMHFRSIFGDGKGDVTLLPADMQHDGALRIGIAPFAAHEGKTYPPQLMHQVVEQLIESHPDIRIYLFGRGEQEEHYFGQWCEQHPQCISINSHLTSLRQELILMSHLSVMVSMDSSNMHLASLTATPVVSIWGATHPYAGFMGWGQSVENAVQMPLDCRPCSIYGQKPCKRGDWACLHGIAPETIVEKIEHILSNPK